MCSLRRLLSHRSNRTSRNCDLRGAYNREAAEMATTRTLEFFGGNLGEGMSEGVGIVSHALRQSLPAGQSKEIMR